MKWISILLFYGLFQTAQAQTPFTVKGEVTANSGYIELYLLKWEAPEWLAIDSTKIQNGAFSFQFRPVETCFYALQVKGSPHLSDFIVSPTEKTVEINGTADQFRSANVQLGASKENKILNELISIFNRYEFRFNQIKKKTQDLLLIDSAYTAKSKALSDERMNIRIAMNTDLRNFGKQYAGSFAADVHVPLMLHPMQKDRPEWEKAYDSYTAFLFDHFFSAINPKEGRILNTPFLERKIQEYLASFSFKNLFEIQKRQIDRLMLLATQNPALHEFMLFYLTDYHRKKDAEKLVDYLKNSYATSCEISDRTAAAFDKAEELKIGQPAPEISLPQMKGNALSLKDYCKKNKATLLVFWASWCTHCKEELPELDKIMQNPEWKGLGVYAVSIDTTQARWEKGAAWLPNGAHVSDLKGANSPPCQNYNLRYTPTIYVLDAKGVIRAKQLKGEKLKNRLRELWPDLP